MIFRRAAAIMLFTAAAPVLLCSARADPITSLFDTGLTSSGAKAQAGTNDVHYALVSSMPAGDSYTTYLWSYDGEPVGRAIFINGSFGGQMEFQTTFSLAGLNPGSAAITGYFTGQGPTDSVAVYLNGGLVSTTTSLDITSGFVAGSNTLDFILNWPAGISGGAAFYTDLTGSADPVGTAVPEPPATAALATAAAILMGLHLRSRRGFSSRERDGAQKPISNMA